MKRTLIITLLACVVCLLAACAACADECQHNNVGYSDLKDGTHSKYCLDCQQPLVASEAHTLEISHPVVPGHYNHVEKCTKCIYSYTASGAAYSYTGTQHTLSCPAPNCPNNNQTEAHQIVYFRVNPEIHVKRCGICPYYKEEDHPSFTIEHTADGKHLDICPRCGEANRFDGVFFDQASEWEHVVICGEGCNTSFKEAHEFIYTDNKDGKTHSMYCEKCNFNVVWEFPVDHVYAYTQVSEGHEPYCSLCEYKANIEAHVIGTQYDKTHHWTSCVCGYGMKDKSEHVRIYSHIRARHIETCGGCDIRYINLYMTKYTSDAKTHTIICSTTGCPMNGQTENHTGGEADCYNKAVCEVCLSEYGNYAHESYFVSNNDGTHNEKCSKCQDPLSDGSCSGGSATCALQAVCGVCKGPYGNTRAHKYASAYTSIGNDKHAKVCTYADCDEYADAQSCAGGAANCLTRALCSACDTVYGELGAHEYEDTHALDAHYLLCALCGDIPDSSRASLGWARLDGDTHVRVCPVEGCAAELDTEAHAFKRVSVSGDYHRQKCEVCGYQKPALNHTMTWKIDKCRFIANCKFCDYRYTKAAHAFDIWESADNARHISECARCQAVREHECEYIAIEQDAALIEICPICGDMLIDGERVVIGEYIAGATSTSIGDNAIPVYANLRVYKFELGYTIAFEHQGAIVEPLGAISVEIPVEDGEPIIIEITQNGIYT